MDRYCEVCGQEHPTSEHQLVPGDRIWVDTVLYMSHGEDDFMGGKAEVSKVRPGISGGQPATYVSVKENPGTDYNWEFLATKQADLKERFGDSPAHADPDDRPQFNEWAGPGDLVSTTTFDRDGNPHRESRVLGPDEHIA